MSDRESINAELELLRDFFIKWENFHEIAKGKIRHRTEMAAQRMVTSADAYKQFKDFHKTEFEAGHG